MADRGREIELKLEIDPADIAALKAHPLLAASIGKTHRQVSTYFDTPKQQLRKSCLALRVTRDGIDFAFQNAQIANRNESLRLR